MKMIVDKFEIKSFKEVEKGINPFQPSIAIYIETRYLICSLNWVTSFYMERDAALKLVKNNNNKITVLQ